MPEPTNGEWIEYRRLVMTSLDALQTDIKGLRAEIQKLRDEIHQRDAEQDKEIFALKLKLASWSALAGASGAGVVAAALKLVEAMA